MKEIELTQGKRALIDDSDLEFVGLRKWFAVFDGYNWYAQSKCNGKAVRLHNYLIDPPMGCEVDHRDGNGLNNQRQNLRICLHLDNMRNVKMKKNNRSGFKGVSWKKKNKNWVAQIRCGAVLHLGSFQDKRDAAMAYDSAAEKYYGEFAMTNKKLGLL